MRKGYRITVQCFLLSLLAIALASASILPSIDEIGRLLELQYAEIADTASLQANKSNNRTEEEYQHPRHSRKRRLNPSVGEGIKILVLPIKFADHRDREVPTKEYLEEFFNGQGSSEVNEVGSVRDWLRRNSNGKYVPHFDVRDWEVSTRTEKETAGGTSGHGQNLFPFFQFALDKIDADPDHDWWSGYASSEGYLNHLVVLHSGYMAESSDLSSCLDHNPERENRIWSTGKSEPIWGEDQWRSSDWIQVAGFSLLSAFGIPTCLSKEPTRFSVGNAVIGPVVHEFSHGFGLPDLYDLNVPPVGGTGRFTTMSSSQGWDFSATTPGHMDGWSRTQIGWAEPHEIKYDGYYALQPLQMSSQLYKISKGYPEGEYLLIENKQPILFDSDVPQGGIVIYHVDENQSLQRNVGYPGSAGWPAAHYMLAVQQADGRYDIERGENIGDVEDFFVKGDKLSPGGDFPNTDSYSTGTLKSTGITIEILSESRFIMVIKVTGLGSRGEGVPMVGAHLAKEFEGIGLNGNSLADIDASDFELVERNTPGETVQWILGMLMGIGLMLGLALFFL